MGILLANCVFTDVYVTNGSDACLLQAQHSKSKLIVIDTHQRYLEKFAQRTVELQKMGIKSVILMNETNNDKYSLKRNGLRVYNWSQTMEIGAKVDN